MSTNPTPTPSNPASINSVLAALEKVGGYVTLAVTVGEAIIPLVKVAVADIKSLFTRGQTVDYSVLVGEDFALLQGVETQAAADIATDDAALAADNQPPVLAPAISPEPPAPADGPATPAPANGSST